jgi:hypothetical protein
MSKPLTHRAICYDDEGRLVCCCPIGAADDVARDEKISRAEAERLVNDYVLESTSRILNTINDMVKR